MHPALAKRIAAKILPALRAIRRLVIADPTLGHLRAVREHELETVAALLPEQGRVLEIGAGTGWQAQALASRGLETWAVDVRSSSYRQDRVFPVIEYDGRTLPFAGASFDVVYSSHTLEHIAHLHALQKEIHRVLKPSGRAIHVLPSGSWRFWTNLTHLCKFLRWPIAHGEHAGNAIAEIFAFSRLTWLGIFRETGWMVTAHRRSGLFYSGTCALDSRLGIRWRKRLSRMLGSSSHVFVLRKPE